MKWKTHITEDHCIWNYLAFIYNIENKTQESEFNGIESYVLEKLESNEINWFPINRAKMMEIESKSIENEFKCKINEISERIKQM